ncbi:hypothetical protein AMTRI_Chr13g122140 [Amborella trichopoda]
MAATGTLPLPFSLSISRPKRSRPSFSRTSSRRNYQRPLVFAVSEEKASEEGGQKASFRPFGFVTDNPSSRSAIQLPEVPAEDGNVGQMLYRIEDKGREYGSYVKAGKFRWFVRETGGYLTVQMADLGFHCFAPDWIGFGFSDKPQPGYGFSYIEEEFHEAFDNLLEALCISSPVILVIQGFLVGSYGLTWALKNPSRVSKITILNSPLTVSSSIPGLFQKLRIPLFGEFTCQNAVMAERFIEAGSPYVLKLEKADIYRLPYLSSSGPGFALLEAARKADFNGVLSRVAMGFSEGRWDKPILLAWGVADKYLPLSIAEEFQKGNPDIISIKALEGAGHMPQEDWPEKVVDALRYFLL